MVHEQDEIGKPPRPPDLPVRPVAFPVEAPEKRAELAVITHRDRILRVGISPHNRGCHARRPTLESRAAEPIYSTGMHSHDHLAAKGIGCRLITVSDTRTPETDESGRLIAEALRRAGHEVRGYTVVPDEPERIRAALEAALADPGVDAVIINGGTGIAPRDVTPEAVCPLLERELPGFGEAFRRLSFEEIGPRALLSRATAGIANGKLVFALPGSPHGVSLALKALIVPLLGHAVFELRRGHAR